jgi:hypothetical protein
MSLASPEIPRAHPAPTLTLLASLLMALGSASVRAQEAEPAAPRAGAVAADRVGLSQSWTDNLRLSPSGSKDAAMVTTVTPVSPGAAGPAGCRAVWTMRSMAWPM